MNKADEKRAFDEMLAEIGDESDEEFGAGDGAWRSTAGNNKGRSGAADAKNISHQQHSYGQQQYKQGGSGGYKMSKEEEEIANFGVQAYGEERQIQAEQVSITKRWLCRPCSQSDRGAMRCYIERDRAGFGLQTVYRCYLEGADENIAAGATTKNAHAARFMMAAKKQVAKKTSYYLVSIDANPEDRGSESVLGKVRGNSVGSRYLITDHGVAPDKTVAPSMLRKEFGVISFEFDSGGPSRIECWVPYVSPSGVMSTWQPDCDKTSMETAVDEKRELDTLFYLQNKAPKWDEAHGGHVLNFQGRVTESSVKNFQLCCPDSDSPDDVVLQFGRVGKHRFTMDLKYPLSPYQAFSICVSCLDGKIADRKGYEYIRKLTGGSGSEDQSVARAEESETETGPNRPNMQRQSSSSAAGNMSGSTSISGKLREALPSSAYIKDKINRTFK